MLPYRPDDGVAVALDRHEEKEQPEMELFYMTCLLATNAAITLPQQGQILVEFSPVSDLTVDTW